MSKGRTSVSVEVMSVAAGAVQELVRVHHAGDTGADPASTRGASGSRQVSESPAGVSLPALRGGTRPGASPGAEPAGKELRSRTAGAPGLESDPAAAATTVAEFVRLVSGIEADVREAYDLLNRSRWEVLNEQEWMTLSVTIASVGNSLGAIEIEWKDRLQRLWEERGLSTSDSEALSESQGRLDDARRLFDSGDMAWEHTIRPIRTTLPVGPGNPVVVESRIVQGTAFGGRFARGYPALRMADPSSCATFYHITRLDQTVLTNANGEVLFSALRHVGVPPPEIDASRLAGLAGEQLRSLIGRMYHRELGWYLPHDRTRAREIETLLMEIGEDRGSAAPRLQAIRHAGRSVMAKVVVTAALVADTAKLHRAIEGETVDLHVGVVSLPGSYDSVSLENERQAFDVWSRPAVPVLVNGPDGALRTVRVNVAVSQFSLGHEEGFLFSDGATVLAVQDLLGPGSTRELGGAVAARVRGIPARVAELRSELAGLGARRLRTIGNRAWGPPAHCRSAGRRRERRTKCTASRGRCAASRSVLVRWRRRDGRSSRYGSIRRRRLSATRCASRWRPGWR